jgi:TRAP-type mannitol/chloroaromatic compound transport system permease large subunit
MTIAVLVLAFVILFVLGVPIAFALGLSTLATMLTTMDFAPAATTIAQRMAGGINSFALLAIPLFVLSGQLMARGGIAHRLIDFSKALIGAVPGGLAFVNVISCMLFGAISGSHADSAKQHPDRLRGRQRRCVDRGAVHRRVYPGHSRRARPDRGLRVLREET